MVKAVVAKPPAVTPAESTGDPPIHVDWVDPSLLGDGRPGRLGLTILPGKRGKSVRYPGLVYRRDARTDLDRLQAKQMWRAAENISARKLCPDRSLAACDRRSTSAN